MSIFDQRGQTVNYQYNINNTIRPESVHDKQQLVELLENLQKEFISAHRNEAINDDVAAEAKYEMEKAVIQSKKVKPEKNVLLKHIEKATLLISGIESLGKLVEALNKAGELIGKLF